MEALRREKTCPESHNHIARAETKIPAPTPALGQEQVPSPANPAASFLLRKQKLFLVLLPSFFHLDYPEFKITQCPLATFMP